MSVPPTLTVAIPTYNRCRRVVPLADQIRRQLRPGDQLIVSDDGSTDGTADALAAIDGLTVVRQPVNLGMVGNWNFCLTAGTNDWVCLIHDDDELLPGGLDALRRGCGVAGGPALVAHGEGRGLRYLSGGGFCYAYRDAGPVAVLDAELCPSGVTLHRAIPAAVGGFDAGHPYSADMEYMPRVCARFPSVIVTHPRVLRYVVEGQNHMLRTWGRPDFLDRLRAVEAAALAHAGLPAAEAAAMLSQRLTRDMLHMVRTAAAAGNAALVRRAARAALAVDGHPPRRRLRLWVAAATGRLPGRGSV